MRYLHGNPPSRGYCTTHRRVETRERGRKEEHEGGKDGGRGKEASEGGREQGEC